MPGAIPRHAIGFFHCSAGAAPELGGITSITQSCREPAQVQHRSASSGVGFPSRAGAFSERFTERTPSVGSVVGCHQPIPQKGLKVYPLFLGMEGLSCARNLSLHIHILLHQICLITTEFLSPPLKVKDYKRNGLTNGDPISGLFFTSVGPNLVELDFSQASIMNHSQREHKVGQSPKKRNKHICWEEGRCIRLHAPFAISCQRQPQPQQLYFSD